MIYFQTKKDIHTIKKLQELVLILWSYEDEAAKKMKDSPIGEVYIWLDGKKPIHQISSQNKKYVEVREQISKIIDEAINVAKRHRISTDFMSLPPPAIGGPAIPDNIFENVLHDLSGSAISRQLIKDTINRTIGACEKDKVREFWKLVNPLHWIITLISNVIRIPFLIVKASGFDIEKIESHLFSKIFKLLEIFILIYILIKLGLTREEIKEVIINLLPF